MPRTFNTTGPCNPDWHYMLPPEARLPTLQPLVNEALYFVLHAPRQTGKTTAMRAFARRLRELGHVALHATIETSQSATETADAEPRWLAAIDIAAHDDLPPEDQPPPPADALSGAVGSRLRAWLSDWSQKVAPRWVVLLLDEADVVTGPAMVDLLRQLRAGFNVRPLKFPASIALIGMRDLRDYLTEAKGGVRINPGSPFNIKVASLTLRNFTEAEVAELYAQHTADTGQVFLPDAIARSFYWSQGHPFLVNALARISVMELRTDLTQPIDAATIDEAKDRLILARTTHLDALGQRLREPRVARIIEAIVTGDIAIPYDHDDFQYVQDLGLVRRGPDGAEIACPLYREILARQLTYNLQENLTRPRWRWQTATGGLDFPALVVAFLDWWRENADALVEDVPLYPEAVPHLAFMAFLQRVVNGGGRVQREYAAGRRALDLCVEYGQDRFIVELKRVRPRDKPASIRRDGLAQVAEYLDLVGEREAWLVLFDQRPGLSWEERLWTEDVVVDGRTVHVVGA